jgi:hypothetical protein
VNIFAYICCILLLLFASVFIFHDLFSYIFFHTQVQDISKMPSVKIFFSSYYIIYEPFVWYIVCNKICICNEAHMSCLTYLCRLKIQSNIFYLVKSFIICEHKRGSPEEYAKHHNDFQIFLRA